MENNKETFSYTYSAKQREEIEKIRKKYVPKEEDKMQTLHRLDANVTKKAMIRSLTVGIIGALIMGSGMSLVMTDLSDIIKLGGNTGMIVGLTLGITGMIITALAYPIYNMTVKKEREKIAPQILKLSDELMEN